MVFDVYHDFATGPRRATVLRQARLHAAACSATGQRPRWRAWWTRVESDLRELAIGGRKLGRWITRSRLEEEDFAAFQAEGEIADRARWLLSCERLPPDGDDGAAVPHPVPHRPLAPGAF